MTPEQQRIAIAKVCGWLVGKVENNVSNSAGEERPWEDVPDYLNDLNAMHEAEKSLFASNSGYYERRYAMLVSSVTSKEGENFEEYAPDGLRDVCDCIHATAAQRAEALLRTLGKWVEP